MNCLDQIKMLDSKIPHTNEYIHTIAFMLCKLKQLGLSAKYYKCLHGLCTGEVEGTHFMVVKCLLLFDLFKPKELSRILNESCCKKCCLL